MTNNIKLVKIWYDEKVEEAYEIAERMLEQRNIKYKKIVKKVEEERNNNGRKS